MSQTASRSRFEKARKAIIVSVLTMPGRPAISAGHEVAELVVLAYPDDRDQVEGAGDAVDLGHALDGEQFLGQRFDPARFDREHDEGGNHALGYPAAAQRPFRPSRFSRSARICAIRLEGRRGARAIRADAVGRSRITNSTSTIPIAPSAQTSRNPHGAARRPQKTRPRSRVRSASGASAGPSCRTGSPAGVRHTLLAALGPPGKTAYTLLTASSRRAFFVAAGQGERGMGV